MPIDLSNVNVSLAQFQAVSSGTYNAGEIRLPPDFRLGLEPTTTFSAVLN